MKKWLSLLFVLVAGGVIAASCAQPTPAPTVTAPPAKTAAPKAQATRPPAKPATRAPATPAPKPPATKTKAPSGPAYFQNKTIEILAATAAGGGTDATARAVAAFLPRYIPGNPRIVVRNQPGAGGVVPTNAFFEKAKPDGLSLLHGSSSVIANQQRGRDIVRYDMRKMVMIGNIGEAGPVVAIRKDALRRLTDPKAEPVVVGTRSGEETWNAIPLYGREFLGWNVRWLTGFGGTGEIVLAFRRGEIDMFGDGQNIKMLADEGLAVTVGQIGSYREGKFTRRSDFLQTPTFVEVLGDKRPGGIAWEGFIAALAPQAVFKFTAAPPGTPDNVTGILREAYSKIAEDAKFQDLLRKTFSEQFEVSVGKETEQLIRESLDVKSEAAAYVDSLLRKFGVIK